MSRPRSVEKPPTRILHVVSGDLWAGAETQIFQLARALKATPAIALRVAVMNPGTLASRLTEEGVDVLILDESRHSFVELAQALTQLNKEWKPHIVHTHRRKEHVLGALSARASGAKLVATIHGASEFTYPWWDLRHQFLLRLERAVLTRYFQLIVAVSQELRDSLRKTYQQVAMLPNGVDIAAIRNAATACDPPVDANATRLVFIGRLAPVKRVDRIIDTVELLHKSEPGRWSLYIIGDGPLEAALKRKAQRLDAVNYIHFTGPIENPFPWLSKMHALVLASDHEGLPMTALEALALNIPFIAPAKGGLSELARDAGIQDFLFDTDRELRGVLLKQLQEARGKRRPACTLPKKYQIDSVTAQYLKLYGGLANR
ncbi:glycosyltransferase [Lentisalinibacter sediminis]|uniref:glycosyltransferase n=1 Tax=Lentisalinibacter sediminis TaxID=2992237 RepID=UPI00386FC1EF